MPEGVPFPQQVFLQSYAKLARCWEPGAGLVRDRAHWPAGTCDSVPASGLFCLATSAAAKMGLVKPAVAERVLGKIHATVSKVPRAKGLLPCFVQKTGGQYRIREGTEYSTLDTSVYYHSMFLAAQMLWDGKTLAGLTKAVREIEFDHLRDSQGYVLHGLQDDGQTPLDASWRDWGGETALVLLLEHMVMGENARLKMDRVGEGARRRRLHRRDPEPLLPGLLVQRARRDHRGELACRPSRPARRAEGLRPRQVEGLGRGQRGLLRAVRG